MSTPVASKVSDIIVNTFHLAVERGSPEVVALAGQNLHSDLAFDELDVLELVMICEDTFGIEIEDREVKRLDTVNSLVEIIASKVSK